MKDIVVAVSSKDNLLDDVHGVVAQLADDPQLSFASGKDMKRIIVDTASNLFLDEKLVFVIVEPALDLLGQVRSQLEALKERVQIVVAFSANPGDKLHEVIDAKVLVIEQDKEKRLKEKVRTFLKKYEKKMTDKAYDLLAERIRDEAVLEPELMKLVNYVGDKATIESKDIRAIVSESHEENLMGLFEAFQRGDKRSMLTILENLQENGQHMLSIHSYLINQIRLLLQAKDMEHMVRPGADYGAFSKAFKEWKEHFELKGTEKRRYLPSQHPFYAFKLSQVARKISRKNLLDFFDMLSTFDVQVKTGVKHDRIRMEYGLLKA